MPDQNQPSDPSQTSTPGGARPVLTTEEVPTHSTGSGQATPQTQDPVLPLTPTNPPIVPDTSDIPPPPPGTEPTDTVIPPGPTDTSPNFDLPPVVGPPPRKKFGGKRVISTILGLLLLIGGVGAGVTLVKQNQDIGERAACSPAECNDSKNPDAKCGSGEICKAKCCVAKTVATATPKPATPKPDSGGGGGGGCSNASAARCQGKNPGFVCDNNPPGSGICTAKGDGSKGSDGKAVCICKRTDTACKEECPSSDGILRNCTPPEADGTPEESICNKVGRIEACGGKSYCCPSAGGKWTTNMSACEGSGTCLNVKAYKGDDTFTAMTTDDLKALKAGDKVRFAIAGSVSAGTSGNYDKAKFKVNSTESGEVTQQKPGSNEFWFEYTIPEGTTSFNITAQIHHTVLGWSN